MTQHSHLTTSNGLDYERTLILAVEVSSRSWIVPAQHIGPAELARCEAH